MQNKSERENEILQTMALYDSLVSAGKLTDKEYKALQGKKKLSDSEAKWEFLKKQNKDFWDRMNNYNHSPIDLAKQIYKRTIENKSKASATYLLTGIPATNGKIVYSDKLLIPYEVDFIKEFDQLNESEILLFIGELAEYKQDPLAILGIWLLKNENGPKKWIMALCNESGNSNPGWIDGLYYDTNTCKVIKDNPDEDEDFANI